VSNMITNMVFALDITAIGVLAANSAVMTASGAPAELPRTESAGNLRASPGKIRNRENKEKKKRGRDDARGGKLAFAVLQHQEEHGTASTLRHKPVKAHVLAYIFWGRMTRFSP
jgi:hypothetical protein